MATVTKPKPLADEEIDRILSGLDAKDRAKLQRFTREKVDRSGIQGVIDTSRTFDKFRRQVIDDIYGKGQTLSEFEEEPPSSGGQKWE